MVLTPDIIRQKFPAQASRLSDEMCKAFIAFCESKSLDPIAGHAVPQIRRDKRSGRDVMAPLTTIAGQRYIAVKTGEYEGQGGPHYCGADGEWKDVWLSASPPSAARVTVYRKGMKHGFTAVALWSEYGEGSGLWLSKPAFMLGKVAEAGALRRAYPDVLSEAYVLEEMESEQPADVSRETPNAQIATAASSEPLGSETWATICEELRLITPAMIEEWRQMRMGMAGRMTKEQIAHVRSELERIRSSEPISQQDKESHDEQP